MQSIGLETIGIDETEAEQRALLGSKRATGYCAIARA
jgi:hypothetical protein